ncbi:MAG: hypothetical protein C0439_06230 [Pseudomonas sp.]|nr:hypothetical protein [Pseudomonas sp.]
MSDDEKWSGYNLAKHALGILVSHFSARIFTERKGASPDHEQIEKWRNERAELMRLGRTLTVNDMATIGRVIEEYGPRAKAITGKE